MLLMPYPGMRSSLPDSGLEYNVIQHALFELGILPKYTTKPLCLENCKICEYSIPIPRELYELFYNVLCVEPQKRMSATEAAELLLNYLEARQVYKRV